MKNMECPQCGNALANGVAVCGSCGKEVKDNEGVRPAPASNPGSKKVYAIIALLLVLLAGVAVLIFTGLLPNPIKGGATAAIVNGEKISMAEVDQKLELYQKMSGQSGKPDSTPEGKAAAAEMKMQILDRLIQEKILLTEAANEKITVTPQEIAERITTVKKSMKFSDNDFEAFLKNHSMTQANFEKRVEKDLLISNLIDKGIKEKKLTKEVWIDQLNKRAKVETLAKF